MKGFIVIEVYGEIVGTVPEDVIPLSKAREYLNQFPYSRKEKWG